MKAQLVQKNWPMPWQGGNFNGTMPKIFEGKGGELLVVWQAGLTSYNGDPTGRDAAIWLARLSRGAKEWSYPEVFASDIRYPNQDPALFRSKDGSIWCV